MNKFRRILLVDDDAVTNYVNEELISEMNITDQVIVAENGARALDFLRKNWLNPDNTVKNDCTGNLILLDINMPVMDGFDFLDEFQKYKVNSHIQVVLVTTSDNRKDIERAKNYPIAAYLVKPLSAEKLTDLLENISG